jgi:shikimate dehydrogenase
VPGTPNGATHVVGIVGGTRQVPLSLSPRIHNAAFGALGLDWVYVGFPVEEGNAPAAVAGLAAAGVRGFNVTMPHKIAVAACMDRLEGLAATVGAVNTVEVRSGGELVGWNTDGEGLLRYIRRDIGADVRGAAVVVLGSGGAARSAVATLARAGAGSVTVLARNPARAEELRGLVRGAGFRVGALGPEAEALVSGADFIVNATPIGQAPSGPGDGDGGLHALEPPAVIPDAVAVAVPIPVDAIAPHCVLVDMVYKPPVTRLVDLARARGASAHGGLGMLLHQAALAFEIWTGQEAPIEAMSAAAVSELRPA